MKLPFLKEKNTPRIAPEPRHEKLYGGSASDQLEDYCIEELIDASKTKDVMSFRRALEALVMNLVGESL